MLTCDLLGIDEKDSINDSDEKKILKATDSIELRGSY